MFCSGKSRQNYDRNSEGSACLPRKRVAEATWEVCSWPPRSGAAAGRGEAALPPLAAAALHWGGGLGAGWEEAVSIYKTLELQKLTGSRGGEWL